MGPTYRFVLSNRAGEDLGELTGATERFVERRLNGIPTASFTLPLSDPLAPGLVDPDAEHLLRVYRQPDGAAPELIFHGPVVDCETVFSVEGRAGVRVNAAGPLWMLTHRYARSMSGGSPTMEPLTYTNQQRALVARDLILRANTDGETGISVPGALSFPSTGTVSVSYVFREVAEAVAELSAGQLGAMTADGFDFTVTPTEYAAGKIGTLRVGPLSSSNPDNIAPTLRGVRRPEVIFELGPGTRNNGIEARQTTTRGGLANVVWHPLRPGMSIIGATDAASISARGRHEAVVSAEIDDPAFRQDLVNAHVAVRKQARRIITFTPAPEDGTARVPMADADYLVGDTVILRVTSYGQVVVNAELRIYGIQTEIGDTGEGRHTLTLVPEV